MKPLVRVAFFISYYGLFNKNTMLFYRIQV